MPQPNVLPPEILARVRALALEQVQLMDELAKAYQADDVPRMKDLVRRLCDLEKEIEQQ